MMSKWIIILSGLLVMQLLLGLSVNLSGEDYGAFQAQEKLLVFDAKSVDGLRIEDDKDSLQLNKREGQWLLTDSEDFPANQSSVERLLDKLAKLEKGWPVATSSGAARRFKVSDGQFERKLTLLADEEPLAELYLGSSPGFRKVHVRPADEDAVFAVAFNNWEANVKVDDWIDKEILKLDAAEISRLEMPGFVLQREDGKLNLVDMAEAEMMEEEAVSTLIDKLAGLRIQSLLGTESLPEYQQDEPEFEIKLAQKGGDTFTYRFSKPEEEAYYVLKRSDLDQYFQIPEFAVKPIQESTRDKLVQVTEVESAAVADEDTSAAEVATGVVE